LLDQPSNLAFHFVTEGALPRSQGGASMRAYPTAAGMAPGLVALWAALVPLLA
jgi:hypothetical protein